MGFEIFIEGCAVNVIGFEAESGVLACAVINPGAFTDDMMVEFGAIFLIKGTTIGTTHSYSPWLIRYD